MTRPKKPHPAHRARRITGAVSAASFLGLGAWFAVTAPHASSTAAFTGAATTSTKSESTDLDDEIEKAATSYSSSSSSSTASTSTASTASRAHTTSNGS